MQKSGRKLLYPINYPLQDFNAAVPRRIFSRLPFPDSQVHRLYRLSVKSRSLVWLTSVKLKVDAPEQKETSLLPVCGLY